MSEITQWEYLWLMAEPTDQGWSASLNGERGAVSAIANKLGERGWELVTSNSIEASILAKSDSSRAAQRAGLTYTKAIEYVFRRLKGST